ncbi:hypothetical protein FXW30_00105 [Candidatus Liberibacter asiaticus]|nr:hypothetical protein FXW22_00070 [Candidatus Liberibacter asiaticus]KAE9511301.1 hypothetical protein FXW31_02170 [Candidatus Liberibacter asiaticus]KAE9512763.1 hypothetical protein FXW32_00070 [Candidatus Liberibacter asiaticus]KAE9513850.1 hypothetical protein FXW35_00120 [Candidatus Liberibacter asiaticus]KAE9514922.1 hypothetical protein FXW25_00045 [Candidatus Liberibacter asiaticus]
MFYDVAKDILNHMEDNYLKESYIYFFDIFLIYHDEYFLHEIFLY